MTEPVPKRRTWDDSEVFFDPKKSPRLSEVAILEHLPGKHDQRSHGRRGSSAGGGGGEFGNNEVTEAQLRMAINQLYKHGDGSVFVTSEELSTFTWNTPADKVRAHLGAPGPSDAQVKAVEAKLQEHPDWSRVEFGATWDGAGNLIAIHRGDANQCPIPHNVAAQTHTMTHNHPEIGGTFGGPTGGARRYEPAMSPGDYRWATGWNVSRVRVTGLMETGPMGHEWRRDFSTNPSSAQFGSQGWEFREHLGGKHDQRSHGRRGGGGVAPGGAGIPEPDKDFLDIQTKPGDEYDVPGTGVWADMDRKRDWPDSTGPNERSVRRAAEDIRNQELETAVVWDAYGNKICRKRGLAHEVQIPSAASAQAHTMIHNHPTPPEGFVCAPPSGADMQFCATYNVRQMRVVSRDSTYVIKVPQGQDFPDLRAHGYNPAFKAYQSPRGGRTREALEGSEATLRKACKEAGLKLTIRHHWNKPIGAPRRSVSATMPINPLPAQIGRPVPAREAFIPAETPDGLDIIDEREFFEGWGYTFDDTSSDSRGASGRPGRSAQ